ncbi:MULTISPECIES: class I SAM-dependent methyltransferase [unclassified Uliginosibacterium]|uniref:class I SAM-dependent methyltransferase n=1 Tax=unclassified Uliginosibacterium TaxID=2621521 RepID=UPI000C79A37F|nr:MULTISPECIES: class I SAM-dependent methyltransferase [unclassified Uliginosibacterium]MDO6385505.1 class I SAM-dependent methyltransferase [Uliginosibacterium sp. 31-12]PLK47549.1 class I SAM-dependent methyltransferase [Uliginosibacterium sp. TH139]
MSGLVMMFHLVLDRLARHEQVRVPEPALVMEDPAKVEAFMRAGREDGILAFTYVYNALQTLSLIRPGDTVLDLACGPANQLGVMASLHPQAQFIGLDASAAMLEHGQATLARQQLDNMRLRQGDICKLEGFADASIDVVTSTLSLHHLPDLAALEACFRELRRVLKPGGGVLLIDFGRLRRPQTQEFFATDRADLQPELFTEDYRHSLRAAFSEPELRQLAPVLGSDVSLHRTWMAPFMLALRSPPRWLPDAPAEARARQLISRLQPAQRRDLLDYARFFHFGGMAMPMAI